MKQEHGEFGEPKGEIKEQIEKAVEGFEENAEDALASKKREIGGNLFSEYNLVLERKKELEGKQKEVKVDDFYEELREGEEGKPLRIKEDERKKPKTLRENIDAMKEEKEGQEEVDEELQKINEKLGFIEKNNVLKEALNKRESAEKDMATAFSGELIDESLEEEKGADRKLGEIVLERYKELEKKIRELTEKLIEHEKKKPKLEGREGKEVMSFKREEKEWEEEKEKIEKEIEKIKEKMSSKELLDIFMEDGVEEEIEVESEEIPEVEVEVDPETVVEAPTEPEAATETAPATGDMWGKIKSFFGGLFLFVGYFFSSLLEKFKKNKKKD
jgi:hypothetical protein